jgi:hypothetical protein
MIEIEKDAIEYLESLGSYDVYSRFDGGKTIKYVTPYGDRVSVTFSGKLDMNLLILEEKTQVIEKLKNKISYYKELLKAAETQYNNIKP